MNSKIVLLLMLYFVSTQASHYPDLLQALDSLLCENVDKKYSTIIDIKQSISKGADLVDGTLADNLGSCISECCGQERCDFALYKIEGSSSSGKNCYFINCGSSMSNCVLVDHPGFTSVVMGRRKQNKEEISEQYLTHLTCTHNVRHTSHHTPYPLHVICTHHTHHMLHTTRTHSPS